MESRGYKRAVQNSIVAVLRYLLCFFAFFHQAPCLRQKKQLLNATRRMKLENQILYLRQAYYHCIFLL
jgi:hypothetical protein